MLRSLLALALSTGMLLAPTVQAVAQESGAASSDAAPTPAPENAEEAASELATNRYFYALPQPVTQATAFEVTVEGPDSVCAMSFQGQYRKGAPWSFTYRPGGQERLSVRLCSGQWWTGLITASEAFSIDRQVLRDTADRFTVNSSVGEDAKVSVSTFDGKLVASSALPTGATARLSVGPGARTLRVQVQTLSGLRQVFRVTRMSGWSVLDRRQGAAFEPCATIPWSYRDQGRPDRTSARAIRADIRGALARIAKITGLTFVEVADGPAAPQRSKAAPEVAPGHMRFAWANLKQAEGRAWVETGLVQLNAGSDWAGDDSSGGFGPTGWGPGGRGWLVIHEVMHMLGLDHVNDSSEVMHATENNHLRFGPGDIAGLKALYPSARCG